MGSNDKKKTEEESVNIHRPKGNQDIGATRLKELQVTPINMFKKIEE